MFIVGKANKNEIKEIKKLGFEVDEIDVRYFDLAFAIKKGCDTNRYLEEHVDSGDDKLVAIYLDCDVVQECRTINALEKLVNVVTGD